MDPSRKHTVICTAGHIDHGKSALVYSLTGTHPDTLKEEMDREMTIELGFAFYGSDVTFIDVPGHEKFVRTMLAGASGVDGAMLVVAADDGVMPQTREHFEVLQLLGIKTGVVALTKVDLVEKEWLDLVREEIRALTAGSFMQAAPILPVSNRTGEGIEELKRELDLMIRQVTPRRDRGLFRMWVDRSFTIKGSGTVVAGTVLSGSLKSGERVEILPPGIVARVKRIQIHKEDATGCRIGDRAALNLPGVDKEAVQRGFLIAAPDHYQPTYMINARLHLLQSAPRPIEDRTRLRLHLGSSEHFCRVALLEEKQIPPGRSAFVQLRLEDPGVADVGDRLVIRAFSEGRVIGGGAVLEVHPPKSKGATPEFLERLARLETAQPLEIIRQFIERKGFTGCDVSSIAREASFLESEVLDVISALHRDGEVVRYTPPPRWGIVASTHWFAGRETLLKWLEEFHSTFPQFKGARRSEAKTKISPNALAMIVDRLIDALVDENLVALEGDLIRLASHSVSLNDAQEELAAEILKMFVAAKFIPPDPKSIAETLTRKGREVDSVITGLTERGELVKLHDPDGSVILYAKDAVDEARRILLEMFDATAEIKFTDFRQRLGSTRKYTTPLAMLFDSEGISYRDGDVRKRGKR